jgi:4-amino-4-deoxy-L-arabinose transferase-like glycosyltransferase
MVDTNNKKLLVTILILATVIRFATVLIFFSDYRPTLDAAQWHQAALNFLDGRGLIVNEDLKAYRTPVPALYFVALYSLFGVSFRAIQVANAFLGVFTVWLAYDLIRRSFGATPAFWAGICVSLYPLFLFYAGQMLSETPVIMLIALALWLLWVLRDRSAIWFPPIGIVLGLAVLSRQTVLPIAVLVAIWTFGVRRGDLWYYRFLPALVVLCFLVLTVAPWSIRNYVLLRRFVPLTSQGGLSLWIANNPLADGTAIGSKVLSKPHLDFLPEVDRGIAYQRLAIQFILENPLQFVRLSLHRLLYFWHLTYHGEGFTEIIFLAIYLPLLALAAIGAWEGWCTNRDATLLLLTVPVSLTAVHAVFLPEGRYRFPAELTMCMLAGIGSAWSFGKAIGRSRSTA